MIYSVRACMTLVSILSASAARAECSISADAGASVRTINPAVRADANRLISMSMVPKLTHVDYRAATQRSGCDLGPLTVGDRSYELWSSDAAARERKALPAKKGQPIALLVSIFDMMKAIDSAKTGKAAPIEGYMSTTVSKADLSGWRVYTAMPDTTVLKHDMAEVLAGGATPIFRNGADGKTSIFVSKN